VFPDQHIRKRDTILCGKFVGGCPQKQTSLAGWDFWLSFASAIRSGQSKSLWRNELKYSCVDQGIVRGGWIWKRVIKHADHRW
jgi:hypothetical protein